jgi:propanol-preferring alcohol dehydrogenase
MKAMVLKEFNTPLSLNNNVPTPKPQADEVLIRVKTCGICGTDIKIARGKWNPSAIKMPHILGHEFAGVVEQVGSQVTTVHVGQRVAAYFYITCGKCRYCLNGEENVCEEQRRPGFEAHGAYAEYVKMPAANLLPLGEGISFEQAAVLPDAVAVPHHALVQLGRLRPGENVLIVGIGGLGVHAIQIVKALGGRAIATDIDDSRLEMALRLGANAALNAGNREIVSKIREITGGYGVDLCVDFVGTMSSFSWALNATRKKGRYVLVGYSANHPLEIDTMPFHLWEWELIGCRGSSKDDLKAVIELTEKGLISPVIDKVYRLEEANTGLEDLEKGKILGRGVIKI